jgi:hypothetical protein
MRDFPQSHFPAAEIPSAHRPSAGKIQQILGFAVSVAKNSLFSGNFPCLLGLGAVLPVAD